MIPHKYPGILIDLSGIEVIWLHYSRFYMNLEKSFDNRIHVFKEPNGIFYKLTGPYSENLLEEAKDKTMKYKDKMKIEILNTSFDHETYVQICQDIRVKFNKIYI